MCTAVLQRRRRFSPVFRPVGLLFWVVRGAVQRDGPKSDQDHMAALADFGGSGKMDRGLGRRATADVLWDQVSKIRLKNNISSEFEMQRTL